MGESDLSAKASSRSTALTSLLYCALAALLSRRVCCGGSSDSAGGAGVVELQSSTAHLCASPLHLSFGLCADARGRTNARRIIATSSVRVIFIIVSKLQPCWW